MPYFDIKEYSPLIDSSCMGPTNWVDIATDIEQNCLNYDGFVVIMGTDTMAYAGSALSFMLENLAKTVMLQAHKFLLRRYTMMLVAILW